MSFKGGPSTNSGVNYELAYLSYRLIDLLFNEIKSIRPQCRVNPTISIEETEPVHIDDILIENIKGRYEFCNVKSIAPNQHTWSISSLKNAKVLSQFKNQHTQLPDCRLIFVTGSNCFYFKELFNKVSSSDTISELNYTLKGKKYRKDWEDLKKEMNFTDVEMLKFSKLVSFEQFNDVELIKDLCNKKISGHFTNEEHFYNAIYQISVDLSRKSKSINRIELIQKLSDSGIVLKPHLKSEEILEKIQFASSTLGNYPNVNILNDYHISRNEVNKLLNYCKNPSKDKDKRVIILTGEAGSGKTVILRDLLLKLLEENIPVLGIKSDLLMYDSTTQLEAEIKLPEGIIESMAVTTEKYGKAVVLIDQIDALSLIISKDKNILNNYIKLITQLNNIDNLTIIVSCREYDLNYDPILRNYLHKNVIKVELLNKSEILNALKQINKTIDNIPEGLLILLKNPLQLKIFCDLYNDGLVISKIKTLKDLYDILWSQKVILGHNEKENIECIELVVEFMDKNKTLLIPEFMLSKIEESKKILISNSVLISENGKIQFFHQSFFDYCFARIFVEKGISLIDFILKQHQGLFIRSQIKYVLDYLRESDPNIYNASLSELLTNNLYRFHTKLLVIQFLSSKNNISSFEKNVIKELLQVDIDFSVQFIDSITSKDWLVFLINEKFLRKFLLLKNTELTQIIRRKLIYMINEHSKEIIDFLSSISTIKDKEIRDLINEVLWRLEDWSYPKSIKLFSSNLPCFEKMWVYPFVLIKIIKFNPKFVFDEFFKSAKLKVKTLDNPKSARDGNIFRHEDISIFKKLIQWNRNLVIKEAIKIIILIINKGRDKLRNTKFYDDIAFCSYFNFERDLYEHWKFLSITEENLLLLSNENYFEFEKILKSLEKSESITIVELLLSCYSQNYKNLIKEIFKFLTRKDLLLTALSSNYGKYYLLLLINNIYPVLDKRQKNIINDLFLSCKRKRTKRDNDKYIDYPVFELLSAVPKMEISKNSVLNKRLSELERKYGGKYVLEEPYQSRMTGVEAPYSEKAYEKMNFKQLIESFKKYDESTGWGKPRENHLKGGLVEHSRSFADQVSKRPDHFYKFIFEIGDRDDISKVYLESAIGGLVLAKYSSDKIKKLVLRYWNIDEDGFRLSLIRAIEYINSTDTLDLSLINILAEYAINDSDPQIEKWVNLNTNGESGDPLTEGVNHVRGSAVFALMRHAYKTKYPSKLFDILEKVSDDNAISVKCCLIASLQVMFRYNRKRTVKLFNKLTETLHPQIIRYGIECLYFLLKNTNFKTYTPHLKIASQITERRGNTDIANYTGQVLMYAYGNEYPGSFKVLSECFNKIVDIRAGALKYSIANLCSNNIKLAKKSKNIFLKLLSDTSSEIVHTYSLGFANQISVDKFNELYPIISEYSKSTVLNHDSYYYLEYLLKCVNYEPEKCLDLIENYYKLQSPDITLNSITGKEPLEILAGAYNRLTNEKYREKAMDIFDKMLKDDIYRSESQKVLDIVERL